METQAEALARVKKLSPEAHCTLHHGLGGGFQAHVWGKPLSGFHSSYTAACDEAVKNLGGLAMDKAELLEQAKKGFIRSVVVQRTETPRGKQEAALDANVALQHAIEVTTDPGALRKLKRWRKIVLLRHLGIPV